MKTIHLYWGRNRPLTYLRYLTVISFAKLNPEWTIKIWVPTSVSFERPWDTHEQPDFYHGHDYLLDLPGAYIYPIQFEELGIPNNVPEVHKSDLLRWYLLGTEGGLWSDFDILYKRPMFQLNEGAGFCRYRAQAGSHVEFTAIGFLSSIGDAGKEFYHGLFRLGVSKIPQSRYQAFGALLLDEYREESVIKPFHIPPRFVYPYFTCVDTPRYFHPEPLPQDGMVGYHWYAGNPLNAKKEAEVTHETIQSKAAIYAICREALNI